MNEKEADGIGHYERLTDEIQLDTIEIIESGTDRKIINSYRNQHSTSSGSPDFPSDKPVFFHIGMSDIATAKLNVRFGRENTGYLLAA